MKKSLKSIMALALSVTVFAGCGAGAGTGSSPGQAADNGAKPPSNEPVKLTVYGYSSSLTDSEFQKYFVEPVQKKYPNISFDLVTRAGDTNTPEQILASGSYPDLLFVSNIYIGMFNGLGMTMDLAAMAKKEKLDPARFDPGAMAAIRQFGGKDQLYAFPFSMNYGMTLYNKDIFDKFGVPYPKDMMTWNDMLELGKKLTRQDQGTQYIGIDPGPVDQMKEQYSLPYVDVKQEKPVLTSDGFQKLFTLLKQFYEVPGFIGDKKKFDYGKNAFLKDKNVAMLPTWGNGVVGSLEDAADQGQTMNWDFVTQPVFADHPGVGRPANMPVLMIFPKSPHQEAAFQVIQTLTSDDVQTMLNKNGRLTVLNANDIKNQFASELKSFKGKNIPAVFKLKQAPGVVLSDYDVELKKIIQNAAKDMAQNGKDVNTVLRQAQESGEKAMAEAKSGGK